MAIVASSFCKEISLARDSLEKATDFEALHGKNTRSEQHYLIGKALLNCRVSIAPIKNKSESGYRITAVPSCSNARKRADKQAAEIDWVENAKVFQRNETVFTSFGSKIAEDRSLLAVVCGVGIGLPAPEFICVVSTFSHY